MRWQVTRSLAWGLICLVGAMPVAAGQATANLKMGNPSAATADVAQKDNYLLDKPEFVTSYNNSKGTPNWVSWRLTKADLGRAPRDNFYADPDLPAGFLRVDPAEYTGSGFDRGHMCPHGDRTATDQTSLATFAMTNIIPQSHAVNTMAWESLEDYCRTLVQTGGKTCYIIAGPGGPPGGVGKNGGQLTTPDGKVTVPSQNWKVVMVLDQDVASAKDLTAEMTIRLIAVIMPNADGQVGNDWAGFITTVNQVEALTGYTFFRDVNPAVINSLKGETDDGGNRGLPERIFGQIGPKATADQVFLMPAPQAPARLVHAPAPLAPARPEEVVPVPDTPTMAALRQAAAGLTYPSEADEPLEVITWGDAHGTLTDAQLWHLFGEDTRARIKRVDATRFFDRLIHPKRPNGQVSPEQAQRFEALFQALKAELTDLEVIEVGQSEVAIYIIGRTKDGKLVGIRTGATET